VPQDGERKQRLPPAKKAKTQKRIKKQKGLRRDTSGGGDWAKITGVMVLGE